MTEFLRKITSKDIRNIIAVIITVGSFVLLYLMLIKEAPKENKELILMAGGFVFAALGAVTGYYFGSSKSETDKAKKEE